MSYIDTFDHELVGFFGGLPLYHPLEEVIGTDVPGEFGCSPEQLVLGGGDGEHPAVILRDPGGAVAICVGLWFDVAVKPDSLPANALAIFDQAPTPARCLTYADWDLELFATFYARFTSLAFPVPYRKDLHTTVEGWLVASLGEFVRYSMPELAIDVIDKLRDVGADIPEPFLFNVTVPPPGYASFFGERGESRIATWGRYRW